MRIQRKKDGTFEARFSKPDWNCFLKIISLFPRVPPAHHRISFKTKSCSEDDSSQALLDEALEEQRAEHRRGLVKILADPAHLSFTERGFVVRLSAADVMCLLQVLNDVRVGSWIALGSPEQIKARPTREQRRDFYTMELAGHYEAGFIAALEAGA